MRRSIFIALGIMAVILGVEFLLIDSANLYAAGDTRPSSFINPAGIPTSNVSVWRPKEWMPWAFLSGGAITVLYAFTLPKRWRGSAA
ncbi:hypothetical protein K227x_15680 [Rubripirellula lacrimiformis]|uniref:Uncharacterized protein n=1 Tax=Rubripirellula lacrimiformis TaxID=1930273 RepID=A0A517N7R6_9BACT|nr:hypothetical protein [Rubripirellula lacrimiformis]QDT03186.1 hypothetical protein K227x_15680 [Rubripirellula lacrimiformis]